MHMLKKAIGSLCFAAATVLLSAYPVKAQEKPLYAIFTIDVESMLHGNPETDIWGRLPGKSHNQGIEKMMDIFDEFGVKATFFVNVYEMPRHGWDASRLVCQTIHNRKHDVELHTHPKPMFGMGWLRQTDLQTQAMLLQAGKDAIEAWINDKVVAHRAGDFSADSNTLIACRLTNIPLDFSWNSAWPPCKLADGKVLNAPFVSDGVLEVPTTCYLQASAGEWNSPRFLDLESSSVEEAVKILQELKAHNTRTVVITIHSFSFSRWGNKHKKIENCLRSVLANFKADPQVKIVTARQLYEIWKADPNALTGNDYVPTTGWLLTYQRAWRRLDEGWKNIAVAFAPIGAILMTIGGLAWLRLRRRKRNEPSNAPIQ